MKLLNAIKTINIFQKKEPLIPLYTKWGKEIDYRHVLEEYPRPYLKRDNYLNLNGFGNTRLQQQNVIHNIFTIKY